MAELQSIGETDEESPPVPDEDPVLEPEVSAQVQPDEGLNELGGEKEEAPNPFDQFDDERTTSLTNSPGYDATLKERFLLNFGKSEQFNVGRAVQRASTKLLTEGETRETVEARQEREDLDFDQLRSSDTTLEYLSAFGGMAAAPLTDPFSYVYAPVRLMGAAFREARPIATQAIEHALSAAGFNAGLDVSVQGIRLAADQQEAYEPVQTLFAAGAGAVIGGGVGGGREALALRKERRAGTADEGEAQPFDEFDDQPPATTEETTILREEVIEERAQQADSVESVPDAEVLAARPKVGRTGPDETPAARAQVGRTGPGTIARPEVGAAAVAGEPKPKRLEDIIIRLTDAVPNPTAFRKGRLSVKVPSGAKAAGQFSRQTGVIRVADTADFQTITHEIAHDYETHFGTALDTIKNTHQVELEPLAYVGAKPGSELSEGFAEFVRHYVSNPAYARAQAPQFFAEFDTFLSTGNKEIFDVLQEARKDYRTWLDSSSGAVLRTDIVSDKTKRMIGSATEEIKRHGLRNTLGTWADNLYEAVIDERHSISVAVKELLAIHRMNHGVELDLRAVNDPVALARLGIDASQSGLVDLMHGVVPYHEVNPAGVSMFKALETALGKRFVGKWDEDALADWGAYLVARRSIVEYDRFIAGEVPNPPGKFTRGDYVQAVQEFEAANSEWRQAAAMTYEFQSNLLRKKHAAGLLTDEQLDAFLKKKDYVPLMRDMRDFGEEVGTGLAQGTRAGGGATGKAAIVQAYRGSLRSVIHPVESIMRDAMETATVIARNDTFEALVSLAEAAGPGGGTIIERVPGSVIKGQQISISEVISNAAREQGLDPRDVQVLRDVTDSTFGAKATGTIFRAGESPEGGEPIIYLWRNGERQMYRLADGDFGRSLYGAMTLFGRDQASTMLNIASLTATSVRVGVTTSPDFLLTNYIRDQMSAWVLSDDFFEFIPFVSGAKGVVSEIRGTEIARLHAQAGGIVGGAEVAALHDARFTRDIQSLRKKGYSVQRLTSLKGAMKLMELTETGTRIALFEATYKRGLKHGLSKYEALIEAGFSSRDFIDFGRHGSRMLFARRLIPFLNASIQGLDKGFRRGVVPFFKLRNGKNLSAKDKKAMGQAAKTWAKVTTLGMIGLGLIALYRDDPEYEELMQYYRHTHWAFKKGAGEWVVMPKPWEFAVLSNIFERAFENAYGGDPLAWERLLEGMGEILVPPINPLKNAPILKVPVELATGQDMFFDRPIIPQSLEGLDPENQWDSYTSEFGKIVGKQLGVSPKYVDHAITGFGASWGRQILNWSNNLESDRADKGLADSFITRRFVKYVARGATSSVKFWDLMAHKSGEMDNAATQYRYFVDRGSSKDAQDYLRGKPEGMAAFALLQEHFPASDKRLHPLRRAKDATLAISALRREIRGGDIAPVEGGAAPVLTPSRKLAVDNVLAYLQMVEHRNALVYSRVRGWAQKETMDSDVVWDELKAASPEIHAELKARYVKKKVYSEKGVREGWPEAQRRILADREEAILDDLVVNAEFGI